MVAELDNTKINDCSFRQNSYGKGRTVVSGVHFEASMDSLAKVYSYDSVVYSLLPGITEQDRQQLLIGILEYLINCKN